MRDYCPNLERVYVMIVMEIGWTHRGLLRHLLGSNNINSLDTGFTVKLIGPLKTDLCDDWPSLSYINS